MPLSNCSWLPTSRGQSAAVYTLTVLLLLNLTVLSLLVSGKFGGSDSFASQAAETEAPRRDEFRSAGREVAEAIEADPSLSSGDEPSRSADIAAVPVVSGAQPGLPVRRSTAPVAHDVTEPIAPAELNQPVQDDEPPIRFFGIEVN